MVEISVILPIYKVEKYLDRCLMSINTQSFSGFDVILVDDGSPDSCGERCDEYALQHAESLVIHQKNTGLSGARNNGLELSICCSDSVWISFIDSDDWIERTYLSQLIEAAKSKKVDISICEYDVVNNARTELTHHVMDTSVYFSEDYWCLDQLNATVAWGKIYKKTLFNGIRYPIGKIHEDSYTTYKMLFACKSISLIAKPLYHYYLSESSISRDPWSPSRLDNLSAHLEQIEFFDQNGYKKALSHEVKIYVSQAYNLICFMKENSPKFDEYIPIQINNLKHIISQYKNIIRYDEYDAHYNLVYSRWQSLMIRILTKIKTILSLEGK